MAAKATVTGAILIALGVIVTIASDSGSVTSMIPAFIGALFVIIGLVAGARPALNHHLMHGAAMLAVLAVLGSLGSLIGRGSSGWALFSQLVTIVVAAGFLYFAVQSFRAARAARVAAESVA